MTENNALLAFAQALAVDAGNVLRDYVGRELTVQMKSSDIDPVTEADRASEELIVGRIQESYPTHAILAEESGERAGERAMWIVDPLDGTVNFAHGDPHYCVSVALYENQTPQLGVIYNPELEELFWAERDGGAWLRRRDGSVRRLRVSSVGRLRDSVIATGFPYRRGTLQRNNLAEFNSMVPEVRGIRRAGSAALDLAYVAAGRYDGYWEFHMEPWDTAAGALMVTEAGGLLRTIDGDEWDAWQDSTVAAGPTLMPRLLEQLQSAHGEHDR